MQPSLTALPSDSLYGGDPSLRSAAERERLAAQNLGPAVYAQRESALEAAKQAREREEQGGQKDGVHAPEYPPLDFAELVFEAYQPPQFRAEGPAVLGLSSFPESIRSWDGRKVELAGFMIASDARDDLLTSFMLCRFPPGCCFGGVPLLDEWVDCKPLYAEKRTFNPYEMVLVDGTFAAGEVVDEDGFVLSIYRLQVDAIRPFE